MEERGGGRNDYDYDENPDRIDRLDRIRGATLARLERSERQIKLAVAAAAAWEALFLAAFLFLMEPGNRLHLLLLVASVGGYSLVALGLIALGAFVNRCTLRVLKALELLGDPGAAG